MWIPVSHWPDVSYRASVQDSNTSLIFPAQKSELHDWMSTAGRSLAEEDDATHHGSSRCRRYSPDLHFNLIRQAVCMWSCSCISPQRTFLPFLGGTCMAPLARACESPCILPISHHRGATPDRSRTENTNQANTHAHSVALSVCLTVVVKGGTVTRSWNTTASAEHVCVRGDLYVSFSAR